MPEGLANLTQVVRAADDRRDLAGFEELPEDGDRFFLVGVGTPGPRSCFTKRERTMSVRKWGMSPDTGLPDAPKRSCPISTYLPSGLSARLQAENGSSPGRRR